MKVFGRTRYGPVVINDTTGQQQPAPGSQNSISVDHEGLPIDAVKW